MKLARLPDWHPDSAATMRIRSQLLKVSYATSERPHYAGAMGRNGSSPSLRLSGTGQSTA